MITVRERKWRRVKKNKDEKKLRNRLKRSSKYYSEDNPNRSHRRRKRRFKYRSYGRILNHIFDKGETLTGPHKVFEIKNRKVQIPSLFSLTKNPNGSYRVIYSIVKFLRDNQNATLTIDYSDCKNLHLDAQIFLDIILKEYINFYKSKAFNYRITIHGLNQVPPEVSKILFSVGTLAIHNVTDIEFPDVVPFRLIERKSNKGVSNVKTISQKELDTTKIVDYVIQCLSKFKGKELTPEKKRDLCNVVGEVLINAEEHSTLGRRYSVGYFQDVHDESMHYGEFKLLIFNFGKSIYEIFRDPKCPNQPEVQKMKELSKSFTSRGILGIKSGIEEETLWTLYALQDGVTSLKDWKRGNGSIRFIESFFNIKGDGSNDDISRLHILSGNTFIHFDGTYKIDVKESSNGEKRTKFKIMAFNKENDIHLSPDNKYVKFADFYFPGTMISANIRINDDDISKN